MGKASITALCQQGQLHQRAEQHWGSCSLGASTPQMRDHSSSLITLMRTPHKTAVSPSSSKVSRQKGATMTSSTLPSSRPAQERGNHSRSAIGLPKALVGLGVGKAIHAVRRAPLRCDICGAVVIVVLTAQAPGGHGPCGDRGIRSAQLNSPILRLLGVSHCAERLACTARARSPPGLLCSHMLPPKQSESWHVLRSKVHGTFPLALPSGSCPRLGTPTQNRLRILQAEPGCDPLHVRQVSCMPLL